MLLGMMGGLGRMGWSYSLPETIVHHGACMVGGFLGSLIALEKIVPLKKPIFFIGPLMSAASLLCFIAGQTYMAILMLCLSSIVLCLVYGFYLFRNYSLYLTIALAGALCWAVGNVLLFSKLFYPKAFPWWMAFVLLTVCSERLELSKFLPVSRLAKKIFIFFLMTFIAGIALPFHLGGNYVAGLALVGIALWLMRYDVISITLKKKGLQAFTARALLAGYVALILTGIFLISLNNTSYSYDSIVHTFFLGFAMAMIFAHGPLILPGLLGWLVKPFHALFYLPLSLLFVSLLIRLLANANLIAFAYRIYSGWLSVTAILLYFVFMLTFMVKGIRHAKVK
ncbi:hypothetical protein SanaruYs_36720 [Chryseotalea sanaruensis]|uniref:Uncharacterized protein n=2 Tax=Chryseotalea sanaruensis TaxID=2482724 RepID=A0A401UEU4_9BACT|nr:hypothetical protein SanaruYs_36720 [Chryseotalea sanaruensis]